MPRGLHTLVCKHAASAPSQGAGRDPGTCLSGFSWTLEAVSFIQLTYCCPVTAFSRRRCRVAPWPGSIGPQVCLYEHRHRDGTAGAGLVRPIPSFVGGRGNEAQRGEVNCSRFKTWQWSWHQNLMSLACPHYSGWFVFIFVCVCVCVSVSLFDL